MVRHMGINQSEKSSGGRACCVRGCGRKQVLCGCMRVCKSQSQWAQLQTGLRVRPQKG